VFSDLVDDVDSVHVGCTVGDAWGCFIDAFIALDTFDANLGVEFVDVIVALVVFSRRVEDCICS
jgi:hypothetical protein